MKGQVATSEKNDDYRLYFPIFQVNVDTYCALESLTDMESLFPDTMPHKIRVNLRLS